jgi:hypothetical protein
MRRLTSLAWKADEGNQPSFCVHVVAGVAAKCDAGGTGLAVGAFEVVHELDEGFDAL